MDGTETIITEIAETEQPYYYSEIISYQSEILSDMVEIKEQSETGVTLLFVIIAFLGLIGGILITELTRK